MNTQTTRCANEELSELEEWLKSKGLALVEKNETELEPGEYAKVPEEPEDPASDGSPVWKVIWNPKEE